MIVPPLSGVVNGQTPRDTGWWEGGFTPGQAGPSVIAGHINSAALGNLVFAHLQQLADDFRAGKHDTAQVTLADGQTVTFAVSGYAEPDKSDTAFWGSFWTAAQKTGPPSLVLITCGGDFDTATGHYRSNVVIYLSESVPAG